MKRPRIIIVEDEVIIGRDIQRTLTRLDYDVLALATSGEEALAYVAADRPDLVLMDIHLNSDMDGIDTANQIRSQGRIPIVFLTAYSDEATLTRAKVSGPYGYILKPFEERELKIVIDIALYQYNVESKLRQVERWLATTLKSIGEGVIATDTHGIITFMNPIAELLTGWNEREAVGTPVDQVLQLVRAIDHSPLEALMTRVQRDELIIEVDAHTILIARDGHEVVIDDSVAPIRDETDGMTGVVVVFRDITARKQADERLHYLAMHDVLTGLPNRALLIDRLSLALQRMRRHTDYRFAVLYLDVDRFKVVNDSLGHVAGDQLLVGLARRLEESTRIQDVVARLGGDEFVILIDNIVDVRSVIQICERIQQHLEEPIELNGHELFPRFSIGIVLSGPEYEHAEALLRDADSALYRAKASGKNQYALFDTQLHVNAITMLRLESDLRRAVAREEFTIYYQPIVAFASGQIHGFEALLRWTHPEQGLLAPGAFLELAEDTGILVAICEWMLRQACRQVLSWQPLIPATSLAISVNLSNSQFWQPLLYEQVARVLAETGLPADQLCLEITENVVGDRQRSAEILTKLDQLDVQLHVDDFGTGYSSLSILHHVPINTLKIDRAFVRGLDSPGLQESAIVRSIVALARALNLSVIAEGIETKAQAMSLRDLGCEYGQGYWFAQPLPADAVEALLRSDRFDGSLFSQACSC